ncbi:MAG: phage terminase large subunit [Planctomycetaceae bacterium]|nr:phage terminase large subunit [Planctomycetaceae bacterium]
MKLTEAQQKARVLLGSEARNILLYGGSRSGKTFVICRRLIANALRLPCRQVIFRRNFNAVKRSIGQDTFPKLISMLKINEFITLNKTDWVFHFHGCEGEGSEIWLLGLDDKERVDKILGMEFATIFMNECSEIPWETVEKAYSRLAEKHETKLKNRAYFDCNPPSKSHWTHRAFISQINPATKIAWPKPELWQCMRLNPDDNTENLPEGYIDNSLKSLSSKNQLRFYKGEWQDDTENALWKRSLIDATRVTSFPDDLRRIVIAVDPAVTYSEGSDYTGIVVAGRKENHYYVMDDRTMKSSPEEWARVVDLLYHQYSADRVVVETNNGGSLLRSLFKSTNRMLPITEVFAKRSKILRAEPIAAMYERGEVSHVGEFTDLEDQMCSYTGLDSEGSPDNLDALVYALTALSDQIGNVTQISGHFGVF